jgi:hypothetical protein
VYKGARAPSAGTRAISIVWPHTRPLISFHC